MTETLAEKTCTPCRGGVPPLGRDEALRFQAQAPDWELRDEARRIERTFRFRNFREALAFVHAIAWIVLIFGERHLRQILALYSSYYNETRTHLGLGKDAPLGRAIQRSGTIIATPILSGLHHRYARI